MSAVKEVLKATKRTKIATQGDRNPIIFLSLLTLFTLLRYSLCKFLTSGNQKSNFVIKGKYELYSLIEIKLLDLPENIGMQLVLIGGAIPKSF